MREAGSSLRGRERSKSCSTGGEGEAGIRVYQSALFHVIKKGLLAPETKNGVQKPRQTPPKMVI